MSETMDRYNTDSIRNVALVAHSGAGKTSLAEAMYYVTGKASRLGRVEEHNTISDYDPDEHERGMSINLAAVACEWNELKINVIDTPGYADFVGEVISGLNATDAAAVLVDATAGIEVGTEIVWRLAADLNRPRLLIVSRVDRDNADTDSVVDDLRDRFGANVAPIQVPIGNGPDFRGVVDLLDGKARIFSENGSPISEVPDDFADIVEDAREQLVEAVASTDDDLLEQYLEGEELQRSDLERALRAGIADSSIFPVLFTAATELRGVREAIDSLATLAPSPAERLEQMLDGDAPPIDGPVVAQVFKTLADPFVGKVSMFRLFAGQISGDAQLVDQRTGQTERLANIQYAVGKEGTPALQMAAGDIAFVTKLDGVTTGDTLTANAQSMSLPAFDMPHPLFEASITPETSADLDKMGTALARLAEEDPSLQTYRNDETAETILAGLGESHVRISLERVRRKFGVGLKADVPRVAYRETIRRTVNAHGRHKRQSGGHGQFGDVHIEFSPLPRGSGFQFEDRVVGGRVPRQYIPAVEKGLVETIDRGLLAGYPVVDLKAALFDGQYHSVDSSDESFRIAARLAYEDGIPNAGPVILEPILKLEILIPDGNTGDVIGDISSKRGHVLGMAPADGDPGFSIVEVEAPEAEVQRYATDLRSITQGRGRFTREFVRYEEAPPNVQEQIVAMATREREGSG
jgi:elongation factor G